MRSGRPGNLLRSNSPGRFPNADTLRVDMMEIYQRVAKQNIAFVPGTYFYATQGAGKGAMRLYFTMRNAALARIRSSAPGAWYRQCRQWCLC
jgi:DNA-binding transcriptional MocR family regulator